MIQGAERTSKRNQSGNLAVLSELMNIVGNDSRLKILFLLVEGELCVCKIYDSLGLSQSLVSHHLAVLRAHDLVNARKEGRWVYYSLDKEALGKFNDLYLAIFGIDTIETNKTNTLNCK